MSAKKTGPGGNPFRLTPGAGRCFRHASFSRAKVHLRFVLTEGEGMFVLTGEPGTGKTSLILEVMRELRSSPVRIAQLSCNPVGPEALLAQIAASFQASAVAAAVEAVRARAAESTDKESAGKSSVEMEAVGKQSVGTASAGPPASTPVLAHAGVADMDSFTAIKHWIRASRQSVRRHLLILDEVQVLPDESLEQVRLLTNLQVGAEPQLQVFLAGQDEFRSRLMKPERESFRQRITASCVLSPLSLDECADYVKHRWQAVKEGEPLPFDQSCLPLIHEHSRGTPRLINQVCSRALLHAQVENKTQLLAEDLRAVIAELHDDGLSGHESPNADAA